MPNNLRRKRRVATGIEAHIDEIIGRLANNPAVEHIASLPFSVESFQTDFNAQLEKFLEQNFAEEERSFWTETLSLNDCKIFSDDETVMFVKIFGTCAGIFGFGETNGKFKILSLSFIESRKHFDKQLTDFVFSLFMKTFLPKVATSEIIAVLKENNFFTVAGIVFELVQTGKFNMLNVSVE
ncbi:MAG: hypothetical protein IJ685_02450 [Selenomonadaceae bacterium]|nr:hypothetical protein [Selenomonadaceae bacterium]